MPDDFYVGYQDRTPAFVRRIALGLVVVAVALGGLLAASQSPFRPSVYEFGVVREYVGWLSTDPLPAFYTRVPGHDEAALPSDGHVCGSTYSVYPITRAGTKLGASDLAEAWNGRLVRLEASLIHLDGETMLDLFPDSIAPLEAIDGEDAPHEFASQVEDLGVQTLIGELIDTKCHLGLMNPSTGKVHRSCAARCISSGIPPALHVEDAMGRSANLLLVGPKGRSLNREVLRFAGEAVKVRGRVTRHDNLLLLHADPADFQSP